MFDLKEKVALITGGAKGIGYSLAKEFLKNGAKGVALLDVDDKNGKIAAEQLSNEFSKSVIYIRTDVSERKQFEDAFEQTIQTFKQLDIVVNNAGIVHELQWEKCIAVNLQGSITGTLLAIDKYFPTTLGKSQGIIINVSSIFGLAPEQYVPVYSATKYGLIGFTRSVSGPNRCRNLNVKVIAVCPGVTTTAIVTPEGIQVQEEFREALTNNLQKLPAQTPDEFAQHAVSILQKGETGSVWSVSGNVSKEINFPTLFKLPE